MAAYLGGLRILPPVRWISATALAVRFASSYGNRCFYQLYAGRELIGASGSRSARQLVAQLNPSAWPQVLQLVAVDPVDRLTDFGAALPSSRPYNRVRMTFATSSWPADAKFIDVTAGTVPGGAVDAANRIGRILFDTDRDFVFITDPLGPGGTWNFEAAGRDDKPSDGNLGDALEISQAIETSPQDVATDAAGKRLDVTIDAATATVTFTP